MTPMTDHRAEITARHVDGFEVGGGKARFPAAFSSLDIYGAFYTFIIRWGHLQNHRLRASRGFVTAREETTEPNSHTRHMIFGFGANNGPSPASVGEKPFAFSVLFVPYISVSLSVLMTMPCFSFLSIHEKWSISNVYLLVRRNGACLVGWKNHDLVQCLRCTIVQCSCSTNLGFSAEYGNTAARNGRRPIHPISLCSHVWT